MFRVGASYEEKFLLKTLNIDSWNLRNIVSTFGGYTHNTIGPIIRFDYSKKIYFDLKKKIDGL